MTQITQIAEPGSALQKCWERGDDWVGEEWRSFYPATPKGEALVRAALKQLKPTTGYRESDNRGQRRQTRVFENATCRATVTYYPQRPGTFARSIESICIVPTA